MTFPEGIALPILDFRLGRPDAGFPLQGAPGRAEDEGEEDDEDPPESPPPAGARDPCAEAPLNPVENRPHLHHGIDSLLAASDGLPDGHHLVCRTAAIDHRFPDGRHVAGGRGRAGNGLPQPLEGVGRRFDVLGDAIDPGEDPALAGIEGDPDGLELLFQAFRQRLQA